MIFRDFRICHSVRRSRLTTTYSSPYQETSPSSFWVSCGTHVMGYGSCRTGGYSVGQWTSMVIFSLGFLI
ncbi:unnamed protein product, partial [Sphagnum balticum]